MEIDLTRKEYRDLLDMLYIAEWVLNANRDEDDPRTKRYSKVEQKFFAMAKAMKYENLIEYYPEDKNIFRQENMKKRVPPTPSLLNIKTRSFKMTWQSDCQKKI